MQPIIKYPDLPVAKRRDEIIDAMRKHQVVIVVGETGSGKTTQLPKMACELSIEEGKGGRVGCTPVSYTHLTLPTIYSV